MNQTLVRQSAILLDDLLNKYASTDSEVAQLLSALTPYLRDARSGALQAPVEWRDVPGDIFFSEGGLRKYRDIESAYAKFKVQVTGGESPALRALRKDMNSGE